MSVPKLSTIEYISPFFKASNERDLDAAFEYGKARAISTLEKRIAEIRTTTRQHYNRAYGIEND